MMSSRMDWSQLPYDLLERIAGNLDFFPDRVAFGFVCKPWRSAVARSPPALRRARLPWLLLPDYIGLKEVRSFFSLADNRIYTLDFPDDRRRLTCGSPHGWLLVYDFFTSSLRSLSLWNPITGAHSSLPQVPPALLPNRVAVGPRKLVAGSESVVIMIDLGAPNSILCYRKCIGEEHSPAGWAEIPAPDRIDFTYHRGRYFVLPMGECRTSIIDPDTREVVEVVPSVGDQSVSGRRKYLVESSSGEELFLVIAPSLTRTERLDGFEVFKLDRIERESRWSKVRSIGEDVMFVDAHHGVAVPSCDYAGGCRRNCIVFLDETMLFLRSYPVDDATCFRLFDIGTDQIERLPYVHKSMMERKDPSWFIPSL